MTEAIIDTIAEIACEGYSNIRLVAIDLSDFKKLPAEKIALQLYDDIYIIHTSNNAMLLSFEESFIVVYVSSSQLDWKCSCIDLAFVKDVEGALKIYNSA
jgi:hypothetical protein